VSSNASPQISPAEKTAIRKVQTWIALAFWLVCQVAYLCGMFAGSDFSVESLVRQGSFLPLLIFALISAACSYLLSAHAVRPLSRRLEMMSRFTQDAGHELSTPVSIIRSRLQLFERELTQSGESSEHLPVLLRAMDRVDNLIKDLRVLTRAESPNRHLSLSLVRLHQTVTNALAELEMELQSKSMTSQLSVVPVSVVGDEQALQRMLINLLTNALRYGKSGGQVAVSLKKERGNVVLTVADDGPGILEENIPFLFERFYRVEGSRSRATGGSGLGLAIVKAIVDSHNGKISVKSSSSGTSFIITLPQLPHHPALPFLEGRQD
jgi:signal transduction histidine kinase